MYIIFLFLFCKDVAALSQVGFFTASEECLNLVERGDWGPEGGPGGGTQVLYDLYNAACCEHGGLSISRTQNFPGISIV